MDELIRLINNLDLRPEIKCIVLLSKHPKIFSAGANIKQFNESYSYDLITDRFKKLCDTLHLAKKPLIIGVNGKALGGGFELVLYGDIVVVGPSAEFSFPETGLGLIPGLGGTQQFTKVVGRAFASRYILNGDKITGKQLFNMKLASYYIDEAIDFDKKVLDIGRKVSEKSNTSLISGKACIRIAENTGITAGLQFERGVFYPLFQTKGAKEGVKAFLEKRKPDFTGK